MSKVSIAKRLIYSYVIIIAVFLFVSIVGLGLFIRASRQYEYITYYILDRSAVLAVFSDELPVLRRSVRENFSSISWHETADYSERTLALEEFLQAHAELERLVHTYITLLENDPLIEYETRVRALDMAYTLSHNIRDKYLFVIESGLIDGAGLSMEEIEIMGARTIALIESSENLVSLLRAENRRTIGLVMTDINQLVINSIVSIVFGIVISGIVASVLAFFIVSDLRNRMRALNMKLNNINCGNFNEFTHKSEGDELVEVSNHIVDITDTFRRLMREVNNVSAEIGNGNADMRIDTANFLGEYRNAASAVNMLVDKVKLVEIVEAGSKAKSQFLARMSHEIRTPMNAILGITEVQLQKAEIDADMKDAFEKIYVSGDMLLGIINEILDLSKIEAGKMEIFAEKYEAAHLINDVLVLNMLYSESKQIEFIVSVEESLPAYMIGDELRIKQILNNLLSNAFKYTEKGSVKLSVSAEADEQNPGPVTVVATVSDTGPGMSKEQLDKLFDPYSRFNPESNRFTEGTGIGMSITGSLVSLMEGEISVESKPGKGSVFTVRLPQTVSGEQKIGKEAAENLNKLRTVSHVQMKRVKIVQEPMPYGKVLIVDDVIMNLHVAEGLMSPYALQIDYAESGFAAIERIERGDKYDIIFMDHMMPLMDGFETTRRLRSMGYTRPIVALTADTIVGQANLFLKNGFDDFISKPIDIRQLNIVLNRLIRDKHPIEVVEAARLQTRMKAKHSSMASGLKTTEVYDIIQKAFAFNQKNIINEITTALRENDFKAAHLLIHTLKGLAGLLGGGRLLDVADKAEASLRSGSAPTAEQLDLLALEVKRVIDDIERQHPYMFGVHTESPQTEIPLDKDRAKAVFDKLTPFLEESRFDAVGLIDELSRIPLTGELIEQIERVQFGPALNTLIELRKILEV